MTTNISNKPIDIKIKMPKDNKPLLTRRETSGDRMVAKCWIIKHLALHIFAFSAGGLCTYGILTTGFNLNPIPAIAFAIVGASIVSGIIIRVYPPKD